jgi:hypothetical protein
VSSYSSAGYEGPDPPGSGMRPRCDVDRGRDGEGGASLREILDKKETIQNRLLTVRHPIPLAINCREKMQGQ